MFLLILLILVLFPKDASMGAQEGIKMAFEVVIVSILPFAICASGVVYSGLARVIGAVFSPVFTKVFGLSPYGAVALMSGMLGGYPTGSKVICDMIEEGVITKSEGEKMLSYSNVGGLVFSLNVVGKTAFGSYKTGITIYIIHILATLITASLLNKREKHYLNIKDEIYFYKKQKKPLMAIVGKSIASGGSVMISIVSSFVVFYAVIFALQVEKAPLLCGFLEMTKGVIYSGKIKSIPLAALLFSFGGLSVFAQTESICEKWNLSLKQFYKGKIISSVISYFLAWGYVNIASWGKEGLVLTFCAVMVIGTSIILINKKILC